jgi:cytochrome c oxidase cbb3-type subunit 3
MNSTVNSTTEAAGAHDEHVYDGIHEHDNRLPAWWLATLWATVIFGIGYWVWFHTTGMGELPRAAFDRDMRVREEAAAVAAANKPAQAADDTGGALPDVADAAAVERGKAVWASTCLPCHGDKGQGLVGPNLTDNAWIHDSSPKGLQTVIADGVVAKGMPAWKPALGAGRVRDVASFVLSIRNSNVPGGKAAEGTAVQ